MSPAFAASLPEWLTAIGGVGVFIATGVLALLARQQMNTLGLQTKAAQDQVNAIRQTSLDQLSVVAGPPASRRGCCAGKWTRR